jgi:hypothetical protein
MAIAPSASYSLTVRLEIQNRPAMLGRVTSGIGPWISSRWAGSG